MCVSREDKKKHEERTFISIFRSILIDERLFLSLSHSFVSLSKNAFCVFFVFCEDRERLKI